MSALRRNNRLQMAAAVEIRNLHLSIQHSRVGLLATIDVIIFVWDHVISQTAMSIFRLGVGFIDVAPHYIFPFGIKCWLMLLQENDFFFHSFRLDRRDGDLSSGN